MSGDVTVTMKMTPKQAGALYVKTMRLEDEVKALKAERDALALEVDEANDRNAELVEERVALAAQVERLQYYITKYQELGAEFILTEALTKTPRQCLRDIQAEVIESSLLAIGAPITNFALETRSYARGFNFCASLLLQHAAKVRKGGAE